MECADLILLERTHDGVSDTSVVEQHQIILSPWQISVNYQQTMSINQAQIMRFTSHVGKPARDQFCQVILYRLANARTFGAIPGLCILYKSSRVSLRSVIWAPSGYNAPSRFAPAGKASTRSSAAPHGATSKCRFPVPGFFHSCKKSSKIN
jgi:hypothetical protein